MYGLRRMQLIFFNIYHMHHRIDGLGRLAIYLIHFLKSIFLKLGIVKLRSSNISVFMQSACKQYNVIKMLVLLSQTFSRLDCHLMVRKKDKNLCRITNPWTFIILFSTCCFNSIYACIDLAVHAMDFPLQTVTFHKYGSSSTDFLVGSGLAISWSVLRVLAVSECVNNRFFDGLEPQGKLN